MMNNNLTTKFMEGLQAAQKAAQSAGRAQIYPAELLLKAARKVDHNWCRMAVQSCQVLDRRMKSEKGMDSEAELKLFLVELAGRR